ncbi:hypothetical protein [Streptomyces sp. LBL]|uniref:hypothetical protein n=1 Tax=Streptomyces sp. LBL TaxID=2940562 RepID=UPI002473DEAB|nr:hypothetical protein [Streptomyces sp. LBL]
MSDLEGAAKPTLLPMVRGEITEISPAGQEVLATWTLKTALMCQLMQSKTVQNLPTSHYADLSRDRLPSQQMRVFTAYMPPPQYLNGESPIEYRSIPSEARFTTADGVQHRLWSTVVTLRIGWAVLQLISVGPLGYDYEIALSGFAPYVRQLWPIQETVSWPPLMLRSVGDLDQLSDPLKSPHIAI